VSLATLQMSVPASDGLILKGALTYPAGATGRSYPLAVLAHQYPTTRDSYAPLIADLLAAGAATLAFDQRCHGESIVSPRGPIVVDTPEGVTQEAFGAAFVSSVAKVGFHRIENDVVRVASWGVSQNFIAPDRLALVGASVGGSGVLLAAPSLPGVRAVATLGAAGALAFGPDGPDRIRTAIERAAGIRFLLASVSGRSVRGRGQRRSLEPGTRARPRPRRSRQRARDGHLLRGARRAGRLSSGGSGT
jgi:dienelactone hydrolase